MHHLLVKLQFQQQPQHADLKSGRPVKASRKEGGIRLRLIFGYENTQLRYASCRSYVAWGLCEVRILRHVFKQFPRTSAEILN